MANEGEFPKVDGDILYSSEVNKFNTSALLGGGLYNESLINGHPKNWNLNGAWIGSSNVNTSGGFVFPRDTELGSGILFIKANSYNLTTTFAIFKNNRNGGSIWADVATNVSGIVDLTGSLSFSRGDTAFFGLPSSLATGNATVDWSVIAYS